MLVGRAILCTPKERRPQEWSPYPQCLVASSPTPLSFFPGFLITFILRVLCGFWR